MQPSKLSVIGSDIRLGDYFPPRKLSVAEAFLLLSLAQAHVFITEEAGSEGIRAHFLLEVERKHLSPSPCHHLLKTFPNRKLVTVLVDRCRPKQASIILFVFLANPERLWTRSVNKREENTKLLPLPAFLSVC